MLWKKESKRPDALYVDLFAPSIDDCRVVLLADQESHPTKSDEIALQKRNEGNKKFSEYKWLDALELYGDSLRFAPPKSEHISKAYANRATCFLNLKMHANCLKDIELAMDAGYPAHLKAKLDQRKKNCLKQMQEDPQIERQLRIESNEQFPCLANVAEVRKSENGGYSIVAKTDIDVGQIIGIGDPFQQKVLEKFGSTCNTCLKEYGNLVPCTKCACAMFCPDCKDGDWLHKYECGLHFYERDSVRHALQTIKAFPSIDDLMAFVEQCHKNPPQWPDNLLDERSKYQLFFIKTNNQRKEISDMMMAKTCCAYKILLQIPQINQMFPSKKHKRFLMHLIADQILWIRVYSPTVRLAVGMEKYFKHSCYPNVVSWIFDGKLIFYSIKPIGQGEELNLSQITSNIVDSDSTEERQKKLSELGHDKCTCSRCSGRMASPEQCQQMSNDPVYLCVQHNFVNFKHNASMAMDGCSDFLRKYGRMDHCDVMGNVKKIFKHFYEVSLTKNFDHPFSRARLMKTFEKCS